MTGGQDFLEADFVVGAGSVGCALAARLSGNLGARPGNGEHSVWDGRGPRQILPGLCGAAVAAGDEGWFAGLENGSF
jgi:hypothetical protein